MQDDNIGKLCSICKKRDYIPYQCAKCNKDVEYPQSSQFCDQHYWAKETHLCLSDRERQRRDIPKGQKPSYFCGKCNCKLYTVNHYFCEKCSTLYCLKHRHQEQHNCKEKNQSCQLI